MMAGLGFRAREEVARFHATAGDVFHGLVRPAAARETPAGFTARPGKRFDWVAQADAACTAFTRNGFVMIVGALSDSSVVGSGRPSDSDGVGARARVGWLRSWLFADRGSRG